MKIVFYTPEWHKRLLTFMLEEYPNRSRLYLDWWLTQIDIGDESMRKRTFFLMKDNTICGCTTSFSTELLIDGKEQFVYWECNTIISRKLRGQGLGRIIYDNMDCYSDRITAGFTDAAWIVQQKIMSNFTKINTVNVYVSVNRWIVKAILNRIEFWKNKQSEIIIFPDRIDFKDIYFERVTSVDELNIPNDGYWLGDKIELIRDRAFIRNRFFEMYRKYYVYKGVCNDVNSECYFVVRDTKVNGVEMLSLVDYRAKNHKWEKYINKAAILIAGFNKIGAVITLTSRKSGFLRLFPLSIRLNKKLKVSTSIKGFDNEESVLITSADSDLDFVYYT